MTKETRNAIRLILRLMNRRAIFFFWLFVRAFSVLIPPLSLYLVSLIIHALETQQSDSYLLSLIALVFITFIFDNLTRLLSLSRLQFLINKTETDIQKYLISGLQTKDKPKRHETIQTIRNFTDATRMTMEVLIQPGIDGFISLFYLPLLLFIIDFKVFVIQIAYILVYFAIDTYTTEKYQHLKSTQNRRIEDYYAKLQDSNHLVHERSLLNREYNHLNRWFFWEWITLQNAAVTFYTIVLIYLVITVRLGSKHISDVFLITGYLTSTQVFLNSISAVKDRLADTKVALARLIKTKASSIVDFDDLISN